MTSTDMYTLLLNSKGPVHADDLCPMSVDTVTVVDVVTLPVTEIGTGSTSSKNCP